MKSGLALLLLLSSNCVAIVQDQKDTATKARLQHSFSMILAAHPAQTPAVPGVSYELSQDEATAAATLERQMAEMGLLEEEKLVQSTEQFAQVLYTRRQTPAEIDAEMEGWEAGQPAAPMSESEKQARIEEETAAMETFYADAEYAIPKIESNSLVKMRLNLSTAIIAYDYVKEQAAGQPDIPPELIEKNLENLISLRKLVIEEQFRRSK